jgi:hypothetical protein
MRAVAAERGEAALWVLWAKAAFKLMKDLRSADPGAALALLAELSADDLKWLALVAEKLALVAEKMSGQGKIQINPNRR